MAGITANPEDREKLQLPPKSYAAAVEEEAPPPKEPENGTVSINGENYHLPNGNGNSNGNAATNGEHKVSILRIVDTNGSSKSSPSEVDEGNERPTMERQVSKSEYSAEGLDDAPKSPPRQRGRKNKSSTSSSTKSEKVTPESQVKEENESKPSNPDLELKEPNKESTVVYAESKETNASKLVTVKSPLDLEELTKQDQMEEKKRTEKPLYSGRQAGKRWSQSAIRWAPLNVPLQRRLQTLVVLGHTLCIAILMSTFFFLCAIPLFWPILVPYLLYCIFSTASTSGTLSHRSQFIRSLPIWSLFASYFPARLHRSEVLPPTRKYVFGYHPHGIISHGAFAAFGTEALGFSELFPGIKNTLLTLDTNFRIPLYRDYALALGLASVSKESCENLLSKGGPNGEGMGRAITIVVGGASESLGASPRTLRLVLKRRKGFVKLAIRCGADLVPILAFGENDLYDQFNAQSHPVIHKFQLLVKKFLGFTIPLFHARGVFNYDVGLMPYRRPLNIVVGRPITVQQNKNPEQGEIDRIHGEYVKELERLWDTYKDTFARDREGELEIVE